MADESEPIKLPLELFAPDVLLDPVAPPAPLPDTSSQAESCATLTARPSDTAIAARLIARLSVGGAVVPASGAPQ
jgi:hypothetical protein